MSNLNPSPPLPQAIILPGNGVSEPGTAMWYPYVASELGKAISRETGGKLFPGEVILRQFPDWELARESVWIPFLEKDLKACSGTVLIGHSSGAVAALRYLEEHRVLGVVLVSAYHTDLGDPHERKAGYFDRPWNWSRISQNASWIIQFASTDDHLVPIEEQRYVHTMIGSEYREFNDRGHFNYQIKFPELVDVIVQFMDGTIDKQSGTMSDVERMDVSDFQ
ncbi:5772_t:CDS:2 [Ambispora leptoticha]|uniref:5772_t:CDS:1 n=1 Tax=Ambispora leptoticha TaxID=144679 RepID=A0A9N8V722_9GLOM|nr:5772_t:CDS:2 [Ambispora leptoticha]